MNDEDYVELVQELNKHLSELGLHEIADVRYYMRDEEGERPPLDGRTLLRQLLEGVDRYLAVNASETMEQALGTIRRCIGSEEAPIAAFVSGRRSLQTEGYRNRSPH